MARPRTWRPSRRAGRSWTSAPTFSPSAACCTKCSPDADRSSLRPPRLARASSRDEGHEIARLSPASSGASLHGKGCPVTRLRHPSPPAPMSPEGSASAFTTHGRCAGRDRRRATRAVRRPRRRSRPELTTRAARLGIGALRHRHGRGSRMVGGVTAADAPEMRVEINTPGSAGSRSFAISPDATQIAFTADGPRGPQLWIRSLDVTAPRPLQGTEGGEYPFWSPDGRSIGFFAEQQIEAAGDRRGRAADRSPTS